MVIEIRSHFSMLSIGWRLLFWHKPHVQVLWWWWELWLKNICGHIVWVLCIANHGYLRYCGLYLMLDKYTSWAIISATTPCDSWNNWDEDNHTNHCTNYGTNAPRSTIRSINTATTATTAGAAVVIKRRPTAPISTNPRVTITVITCNCCHKSWQ